jgi:hypothetical protein
MDDPFISTAELIGKNTPEAIVQLNRAAEVAPSMPWPYMALAEIYTSRNFGDEGRLLENMRAYRRLCPANVNGFLHLDKVTDRAEAATWARELRALLEKSADPEDGRYWRILWTAEFRTAPQAEYDALRAKVAADVKRLESLPQKENRTLLIALWDGYKLSGQIDAAERMNRLLDPDREFKKIYDAWSEKSGLRSRTPITEEQHRLVMREYAKVSAEWIAKWPDSPIGYEVPFEGQRNKIHTWRQEILESTRPEREKRITLRTIDDLWADHLARASEYRSGVHWVSWSGRDPHREYLLRIHEWFREMEASLPDEIGRRVEYDDAEMADRGAVWTYLTTDQPFGRWKRELSRRLPFAIAAYWGMGA